MKTRAEKDKRYEEKHKEERKAKCMVWGTSVPREKAEKINEYLKKYGYTKVQLIEEGYKALMEQAAERDTDLAKIMDAYDDFFGFELEEMKKKPNRQLNTQLNPIRRAKESKQNVRTGYRQAIFHLCGNNYKERFVVYGERTLYPSGKRT